MLYLTVLFSFALPIGALIFWKKRNGLSLAPFAAGAVCFLLFAMGLEQFFHSVCLGPDTTVSRTIRETPWLYVLYGCLTAGIFEETGRLFGFRFLLRNQTRKEVSAAYGIGHGGIEVILTLGLTYVLMVMVHLGFDLGNEEANTLFLESLRTTGPSVMALAMLERLTAMMLHIGLSIVVFASVYCPGKKAFFPLAILLHGLADAAVGMYQAGILKSIPLVESVAFLCAGCVLAFGIMLYRRMAE